MIERLHPASIFISTILLMTGMNTFAAQTIQLEGNFSAVANKPSISFILNDEDAKTMTPYLIDITQKTFLKEIKLLGNHYKILGFTINYNGGSRSDICNLGNTVDNQATMIRLNGAVGLSQQPTQCSVQYTAIIPEQYVPATSTVAATNATSGADAVSGSNANVVEKPNSGSEGSLAQGRKEIARYLTGLKNNCSQGRYAADINNQSVVYDIRGNKNSLCEVDIAAGNGNPIRCLLSPEDIAVVASSDQIEALNNGQSSTSKLAASVMAKRCHSLS